MSRHWSERQWRMMTDDRMALIELVEKQADGDLVREMPAFSAERTVPVTSQPFAKAARAKNPAE